jgi:uncharacterized repeat protein (TIGR02543 family)/uncharacterized repeat protein (TIGR01451 family)
VNDDNGVFPFTAECKEDNNEMFLINTDYRKYMKKTASVNGVHGNGLYANPVSVLYGDVIKYRISAYNVAQKAGAVVIRDTLPAYLEYVAGTASPSASGIFLQTKTAGSPPQDVLTWTLNNIASMTETVATFDAQPAAGACASQPMFINRAWIATDIATVETDSSVYHQGAGASIVSFAAGYGGAVYNAPPQALDYRTSAQKGVLAVPDEGYAFAGWRHDDYYSLRGERIRAQSGIAHYDTVVIFGNVKLTADFELIRYPVRYYLNGGDDEGRNPPSYTVLMDAVALEPPRKEGDVFIGWTGSNGDIPQKTAVIPKGATGELEFYANYLYSGREDSDATPPPPDKVWSAKGELHIRTSKTGSVVKIYSTDGKLTGLHTLLSTGVTTISLQAGVYIVALNGDIVQKVIIK